MSRLLTIVVLATIILVAGSGYYLWAAQGGQNSGTFCSKLKDEKAYDKKNIAHYKLLIEGKDGWIFRTKNDFREDWSVNKKTLDYLLRLQAAMKEQNAELVVVMPPVRGMIHKDKLYQRDIKKYGMNASDEIWEDYENMISTLRSKGVHAVGITKEQATPNFYYKRNHHWTAEGAEIVARNVAASVKESPYYKATPAKEYETVERDLVPYESSFDKGFETLCDTHVEPEMAQTYETRPKAVAAGSNDLFNQGQDPQVVLLGTSNSVLGSSHANFEGFLKQYLSRDIVNYARVGAGIDASLMDYVSSEHFRSPTPKLVIWEVPGYYDLNVMDDKLFNQVIPAVYGSCQSNPVLSVSEQDVEEGKKITVFDSSDRIAAAGAQAENPKEDVQAGEINAKGLDDMYLHLAFSSPVEESFDINFEYEDGGTKKQHFSRSERDPVDEDFFTLFPSRGADKKLTKVVVSLPKELPEGTDMESDFCLIR